MNKLNITVFNSQTAVTVNFPVHTQVVPQVQFYAEDSNGEFEQQKVPVKLIKSDQITGLFSGVQVSTQNLNGFITIIF